LKSISRIIVLSLAIVICLGILTASASEVQSVNFKGTVHFVAIEGGFWGIVSEDGKNYDPANLGQEFKQEGLPVQITATITNRPNIHMWGTSIEITAIAKQGNSK